MTETITAEPPRVPLATVLRTFLEIGVLSFGGPAGQIALMHRMLVDDRRWLDEKRFLDALNMSMLLPGPEAQQLATWCGWRVAGIGGALVAGSLFVLPGAAMMAVLAYIYAAYGKVDAVEALFFGIKAGVLAIVIEALIKVGRRALKTPLAWGIAAAAFLAIFLLRIPYPLIVLAAGVAGWLSARGALPSTMPAGTVHDRLARRTLGLAAAGAAIWAAPILVVALTLGPTHVLVTIAAFFSKLAVVTFGGAYAALAYVAQQAVQVHGWLAPGEMLDGLGLAETTPGPLVLVMEFVGFLAGWRAPAPFGPLTAGLLGAGITIWTTFVPSMLWILLAAPLVERIGRIPAAAAALTGITAAVVGVILNLTVWFALHVFFRDITETTLGPLTLDLPRLASADPAAILFAAIAAYVLFARHWSIAATVGLTATLGLAAHGLGLS
jgi:chromate transporter